MFFTPIKYDEPVFRPPAEAYSAIIQATIGCSWNKCAFCEMYTSKQFKTKSLDSLKKDIEILAKSYGSVKKVFLADGNAFVLSANKLMPILKEINNAFNKIARISSYALPGDILTKTDEELIELKENGLKLLYIGIESGDNQLLKLHNKSETYQSTVEGISKAHRAGIDTSIMIINGMGGKKYSEQHAINSAKIINELNPKFLSTLTLNFPFGKKHFDTRIDFDYQQQTVVELLDELKLFLSNLNVSGVIFRSNHVSNNLALKGTLSRDQNRLISEIESAANSLPNDEYPVESGIL